jgi:hypothetical protein
MLLIHIQPDSNHILVFGIAHCLQSMSKEAHEPPYCLEFLKAQSKLRMFSDLLRRHMPIHARAYMT